MKISSLDNENQRLKLKHKEELKDQELINTRELHRLKESHQTTEENLKEQLTKLETIRTTLERVRRILYPITNLFFQGNQFIKINTINTKIKS